MIVCGSCGTKNAESESFCTSCGKFLEWVGTRDSEATASPEAPTAVDEAARQAEAAAAAVAAAAVAAAAAAAAAAEAEEKRRAEAEAAAAAARQAEAEAEEKRRAEAEAATAAAAAEAEAAAAAAARQAEAEAEEKRRVEAEAAAAAAARQAEAEAEEKRRVEAEAAAAAAAAAAEAARTPPPRRGGPTRPAAVTIVAVAAESQATPEDLAADPVTGPRPPIPDAASGESLAAAPPEPVPSQPEPVRPTVVASSPTQPPPRTPFAAPPEQPVARQPTLERPVEPKAGAAAASPRRVAQPGDRICGTCGEPNELTRTLCRRCGTTLQAARIEAAPPPLPWWKRIFRRGETQYAAGERTSSMRAGTGRSGSGMRRVRIRQFIEWGLGLLVLLGIVGYVAIPNVQQVANRAISTAVTGAQRMLNPRFEPVRPVSVVASGQIDDHPGEQVFDKYDNTDWRAAGNQPSVSVRFAEPFDLGSLVVYSGAKDKFTETRRPARLQLLFPDGSTAEIDLEDDNAKQEVRVEKAGIDAFELKVLETYGPADAPVTLSEVEVFARR